MLFQNNHKPKLTTEVPKSKERWTQSLEPIKKCSPNKEKRVTLLVFTAIKLYASVRKVEMLGHCSHPMDRANHNCGVFKIISPRACQVKRNEIYHIMQISLQLLFEDPLSPKL